MGTAGVLLRAGEAALLGAVAVPDEEGLFVGVWVGLVVGLADVVVGLGEGLCVVGEGLPDGDAEGLAVVRDGDGETVGEALDIDGNGCGAGTLSLVNIPHSRPTTRPTTATIATNPQIIPALDRGEVGAPAASTPGLGGVTGRAEVAPRSSGWEVAAAPNSEEKSEAAVAPATVGNAVVARSSAVRGSSAVGSRVVSSGSAPGASAGSGETAGNSEVPARSGSASGPGSTGEPEPCGE